MHLSGVNDNFEARHYRTATTFASSWMSFDYTHRERHILQNMASQLLPDPPRYRQWSETIAELLFVIT
jgi:hypothetical protein